MSELVYKYQDVIVDPANGRPIANAAVTIKKSSDGTLATLYDAAGNVTQPNPVYTDNVGLFYFWAEMGTYDLICAFGNGAASRTGVFVDGYVDTQSIINSLPQIVGDYDGTQLTIPPGGSPAHFMAFRGGSSGTPRIYIMPEGTGEANTKAAVKIFSADYYAQLSEPTQTYEDLGLYYSATDDSFNINGKSTRKSSVTSVTSKPINITFNDSASNTALSAFMQRIKAAAKTITAATVGTSTVLTSAAHGYTAPAWVFVEGIVGTLSAMNDQWHYLTAADTNTFTVDFDSTGLAYTSGGTAKKLTNTPKPTVCIGSTLPAITQFDNIGAYVNTDIGVVYGKMIRLYDSTNGSAGYGLKVNGSNGLDIYVGSAVVATADANGLRNANDTVQLGTVAIYTGEGSPEGVVSAAIGSLYLRTDGGATTTLYVKTGGPGSAGWTAK